MTISLLNYERSVKLNCKENCPTFNSLLYHHSCTSHCAFVSRVGSIHISRSNGSLSGSCMWVTGSISELTLICNTLVHQVTWVTGSVGQ